MKNKYFKAALKKAFVSKGFITALLGTAVLAYFTIQEYMNSYSSVLYLVDLLLNLSLFKKAIVFFAALPFASSFSYDWNSGYINSIAIRSGEKNYIFSNIAVCAISGFTAVFGGIFLFMLAILPAMQFAAPELSDIAPYGILMERSPIIYGIVVVSIFSAGSAVWAVAGLALSAWLPNIYIALGSPLIFGYILEAITMKFPPAVNLYKISHGYDVVGKSPLANYLYSIAVFLVIIILLGFVFAYFVKRRIRNEIS